MKKLNPFARISLLGAAGALVAMLAFAAGAGDAVKQSAAKQAAQAQEKATGAAYPIDYCIVSGEKLGSMGDPVVRTYEGREVRFCCAGCIAGFEKDQAKYLTKLDEAVVAANKTEYPLETCVVSGEPLVTSAMGDPVDYMHEGRLVRFCCSHCVSTFNKNPDKYLAKLDAAAARKASGAPADAHDGHHHDHDGHGHDGHQH